MNFTEKLQWYGRDIYHLNISYIQLYRNVVIR